LLYCQALLIIDILINLTQKLFFSDKIFLNGKLGFDEPHLTGWLAAAAHSLDYCCKKVCIELEPIWESESYEFEPVLNGRIRTGLI